MGEQHKKEIELLARDVMEIVLDVAARRLQQTLQEVHDTDLAPLRRALKECQTLTPSLLSGDQAIERLKKINRYVYAVLEGSVRP